MQERADVGAVATVIRDFEELGRLEAEWSDLFADSPVASPPLRFDWLRLWWRTYGAIYGDRGRGLRVVVVRRGPRLLGALPLYATAGGQAVLGVCRLRFLSTGEAESEETCADHLNLLHRRGEAASCLEAIGGLLADPGALPWDELILDNVSPGSPLLNLSDHCAGRYKVQVSGSESCLVADLDGGFESYLKRLSSHSRQHARKMLRVADQVGARFEVADAASVDPFFDQLVELHQRRWTAVGKPGCFASPRFTEFHRALCRAWVPAGRAVLARLSLGGEPIAVHYGFVVGPKFDHYQTGMCSEGVEGLRSPGNTMILMLMRHLAGSGIGLFDFLGGAYAYKQSFATGEVELARVRFRRSNLQASVNLWASDLGRRVLAKSRKLGSRDRLAVGQPTA